MTFFSSRRHNLSTVKILSKSFAAGTALLLLAGCAGAQDGESSSSQAAESSVSYRLVNPGKLTVGLSPDYPPVAYMDGNDIVGADVDLAREVAKRLGLEAEFVPSAWDQLINSVQTERIDIVVSAMPDTPVRQETVDFVDYQTSAGQFYTTPEKAGDFTKKEDACGASIALSTKTPYYTALEKFNKEVCEGGRLESVKIVGTDAGAAARLQLDQGRADLAVQGAENLAYFEAQEPGKYKIVLDPLYEELIGMSVKKDNTELSQEVQRVLDEMYADGTSKKIQAKYGLDSVIKPTINAATS